MVSRDEKERLLNEMLNEPGSATGVVYKCAAGLLIMIGVAFCGSQVDLQDSMRSASAKQTSMQLHASAWVARSVKTFEERRGRFEASVLLQSEIAQR